MNRRLLVLGLDCLGAELLSPHSLAELPNLRRLAMSGISGPLESTLPPITVPAWTSMLSGRDPGELGIYGFRNRRSYAYGDLVSANSRMVRFPRIWDYVGEAGGECIVVGVPQTSPAPAVAGVLVSGFEAESLDGTAFCHPAGFSTEMAQIAEDYRFDISNFRHAQRGEVLRQIRDMTRGHFAVMSHLLRTRRWDFAMLCEIAPDRLHHCFWSYHDPEHPRYQHDSPYRSAVREYYQYLDRLLGDLLELVEDDVGILVVSDHGAKAMFGGVCINELLRERGWLALHEVPAQPTPLLPEHVDWARTRAWGEGGYYGRVFLNIRDRELHGILPPDRRDEARRELSALLQELPLPGGPTLKNDVLWPEAIYREVRGLPPDLVVLFGNLNWRSLGSIGHGRIWLTGNDTGVDEANHARDGLFIFHSPGVASRSLRASILDVVPTALQWLGLAAPDDLTGTSFLSTESL